MSAKESKTLAKNGLIAHDSSALERARRDKWNVAAERSRRTDKWTETLFRALSNRVAKRWRFVSFRGAEGGEWCGIVDVIAIRKDTAKSEHEILRSGDLFEIILVQMKGGSARMPSSDDVARLKAVKKHYDAKEVVLFEWKRGKGCTFSVLRGDDWSPLAATAIFG